MSKHPCPTASSSAGILPAGSWASLHCAQGRLSPCAAAIQPQVRFARLPALRFVVGRERDGRATGVSAFLIGPHDRSGSWPVNPHATRSARRTSGHLDSGRLQRAVPIRLRWARDRWSKLRAQTTGIPSSGERTTSVDNPRIVRVTGTTMISCK